MRESIKQHSGRFAYVSKLYGSGALAGLQNCLNLLRFALLPTEKLTFCARQLAGGLLFVLQTLSGSTLCAAAIVLLTCYRFASPADPFQMFRDSMEVRWILDRVSQSVDASKTSGD